MLLALVGTSLAPAVAKPGGGPPKDDERTNVILVIGDGMGYNSIDAASLYEHGEAAYQSSDDNPYLAADGGPSVTSQVYQDFPTQVGVETGYIFSPDYADIDAWDAPVNLTRHHPELELNVTDSAAAATAMSTGVRTRFGHMGLDRDGQELEDMVDVAAEADLAVGLVTSSRFWAETTNAFAVHGERRKTPTLVDQLLEHEDINVIMGSGHPEFDSDGQPRDPWFTDLTEQHWNHLTGEELIDGMPEWELIDDRREIRWLGTRGALRGNHDLPDKVVGVAQSGGALFRDRGGDRMEAFETPYARNVARLEEMTAATLNLLHEASDEGFFTVIEAATIDGAAHSGEIGRQIEEQMALNASVEAAVKWVEQNSSWEVTTLVVTSDHETGNLWGAGTYESQKFFPLTGEKHEMPAVDYADWTDYDPEDPEAPHYHTHQLVPLFAKGPLAEDFASATSGHDEVRGDYLYNTDIAEVIRAGLEG